MAEEHTHSHDEEPQGIQVDANSLVNRLRIHRAELQNELDMVTIAYQAQLEQNQQLIKRIGELEQEEKPTKSKG